MSDFDPVEINIDFKQNVDTEGKKAQDGIDNVAASTKKMQEQLEKSIAAQKAVIDGLVKEIKTLQDQMSKKIDTGDDKQIADKQDLIEKIDVLNKKLKEQEALLDSLRKKQSAPSTNTLPGLPKDPTAYAKGMNNLNMSIQQVARELPSLAISPQTFILAISNNLPILQDQLQKTRLMNEALRKSGQATVPMWKQVAGAIMSPQTALVALITVGAVYGKDIANWISKTFQLGDAAKLTGDEIKKMTGELSKNLGAELGKLDSLFDTLKTAQQGTKAYANARKEIIDQYGKYLEGMDGEITRLNNIEGAYKAIADAIKEKVREETLQATYKEQGAKLIESTTKQYEIIQKKLYKAFGEVQGQSLFEQIKAQLESGSSLSNELQAIVDEFFISANKKGKYAEDYAGTVKKTINPLQDAVDAVSESQDEYNKKIEATRKLLGGLYSSQTPEIKSLIADQELLLAQAKLMPEGTEKEIAAKNKRIETINAEINRLKDLGKTQTKEANSSLTASEELSQKEQDIELLKNKAILALMQDGLDKRKQLAKQTYDENVSQLDKLEKEYLAKLNKRQNKKPTDVGYVTSLADYTTQNPEDKGAANYLSNLNELKLLEDQKYVKEVEKLDREAADVRKKVWASATQAFLNDIEKEKQAVNQQYDELIKKATENGATQEEIDRLSAQRNLALVNVQSKAALQLSNFYQQLYGDIDRLSAKTLRNLRSQLDEVINSAKQVDRNGQTFIQVEIPTEQFDKDGKAITQTVNMTIAEFQRLMDTGKKLDSSFSRVRPFEALSNAFKSYIESTKRVKDAQERLNEMQQSGTATAEELAKANQDVADAQDDRTESLSKATEAANQVGRDAQRYINAGNDILGMLEDMGVSVSDNTREAINGLNMMAEAIAEVDFTKPGTVITSSIKAAAAQVKFYKAIFGSNKAAKDTAELNRISDRTAVIYEGINKLLQERIDLINEATGAEAAYLDTLNQQTIDQQKKYIEQQFGFLLDNEMFGKKGKNNDLSMSEVMDLFGLGSIAEFIDWYNSGGYNELLAKGYGWTNEDSWASIIDSWNNLTDAAQESADAAQEAITGISFDELKDGIDDLIQDVDTTMSDVADSLEEHLQDGVLNFVKSSYLTDAMREWYDTLSEYYTSGNELTAAEKSQLEQMYKDIYGEAQAIYDAYASAAGIDTSTSSSRAASTKGIAQASQDSVDELNGRMTAIQAFIYDIRNMNQQSLSFETEAAAYQSAMLTYMATIAENTAYCQKLDRIDKTLVDIQLKGIKIKS